MFSFIQITSEGKKSIDAIYHVNRKKGGEGEYQEPFQ